MRGAQALESRMAPAVTQALDRGGLQRDLLLGLGQGTQSNIMKPSGGGNWIEDSVKQALSPLKRNTAGRNDPADILRQMRERYPPEEIEKLHEGARRGIADNFFQLERDVALNNWVDSNLANYVKKQMATEKDPVRRLAEEGISHLPDTTQMSRYIGDVEANRQKTGFPQGLGQSEQAKVWESLADSVIRPKQLGETIRANNPNGMTMRELMLGEPGGQWAAKAPDTEMIYEMRLPGTSSASQIAPELGFDHIMDVLREDVVSGRIRPEQLNKVSMEQAVRRTYEYDQEMAKKMRETALQQQTEFPVFKEYPEQGYKWLELSPIKTLPEGYTLEPNKGWNKGTYPYKVIGREGQELFGATSEADAAKTLVANTKKLEDALKYEGETMGHCVGGYCPDVLAGRTRIFSLRDAKGEPHVTVEVAPDTTQPRIDQIKKYMAAATEEAKQLPQGYTDRDISDIATRMAMENAPPSIVQIKGKQNLAPKDEYLPFVQDFVRGRDWQEINDLHNTGLMSLDDAFPDYEMVKAFNRTYPDKQFVNKKEVEDFTKQFGNPQPPIEGMKRGGVVVSKNPDTMMLEVNNQKMKNGVPAYGAGKLVTSQAVKSTKVPPPIKFPVTRGPSIPEIRAMAERMAPQVMGEFVRAAPTPSNPKPSTSVVGKTQKQFEREKTLPIEYQNIMPEVTPSEFDYAKNKGALLIGTSGDVTPGNRMLLSIDDQPLSAPVHLQAGPEWEMYNPSAWAASDQMAKTYMNRAEKAAEAYGADPYLHYHKMTPDANWYAMHHLNSVLGHLRPEELKLRDPKLYQQMVEEIRTKDLGFGKHPDFEGFDDPLSLQIHAQIDPNFRRHLGAIFGGPKFTERYGLNSGQDVLAATSLPELRDLEAGASGYAIVPLDVKAPLRNFEADSQTYDTGFPKAGPSGRSKYPSPYQLIYRDTLNWMKENPSENKSSEFGRMNMIVPKQQIDDELINAIGEYQKRMKELTGKKKGGAVKKPIKKAAGGAITGDDLIIEERPL
jgi:hypothetical protein